MIDFTARRRERPKIFQRSFNCYSTAAFAGKTSLEGGDKILLPPSSLDQILEMMDVEYPLLFEIINPTS